MAQTRSPLAGWTGRHPDPVIRPALAAALLASAAAAQTGGTAPPRPAAERSAAERPTVGLVLSGGAAKGLAHVGAIRAIEAAGVPVDVVAGTSMGAVVGGLYAVGYSADSLEAVVRGQDWVGLFRDGADRPATPLADRLLGGEVLLSLPVEGGAVGLPSGLVAGQAVFDLLARLTWPVADVRDFRRLPRPFAAVAVDAETGRAERLVTGSLPLAIRASLSLPTLFEPAVVDGRRYLDGGLARSLPAQDALALGADVLVCVDVTELGGFGREPEGSLFDVTVNAVFYQADQALDAERARCDVLIEPDVSGLSSFAFDAGDEWIARGAAAVEAKRAELEALAARAGGRVSVDAPAEETYRVETVDVRGVGGAAERTVRRRLALALPARLSAADVEAAVDRVYATGLFDLVTYRIGDGGGAATLVLDVQPAVGDRLGLGLRYDTVYDVAVLAALTLHDDVGSTARFDVRLGSQTQLQASALTRLGTAVPLDVAAQVGYTSLPAPLSAGLGRLRAAGDLDVASALVAGGPVLLGSVLTGVGPFAAYVRTAPGVEGSGVAASSWAYGALSAFAVADGRDRTAFPSRGGRLLATGAWSPGLGARFRHLTADAEGWLPLGGGVSVGARAAVARAWGDDVPADRRSFVGGAVVPTLLPGRFLPLYGAETLELVGTAAQVAAASVQVALRPRLFLRATANAGRAGAGWTLDPDAFRAGLGLTLGAMTLLGPASLTVGGSGETVDVTVSVGRSF